MVVLNVALFSKWSIVIKLSVMFIDSTHFFVRNSFLKNLYWDSQITKKLSVLKPQRLRNI